MVGQKVIYVGRFVQSIALDELEICSDGAIGVDETGKIAFVRRGPRAGGVSEERNKPGWAEVKQVKIPEAAGFGFYFPGLIDTHIHAAQYPNAGIFGKASLLSWLERYTFPLEASLSSPAQATLIYRRVVRRTLSHGTTTAAYFATIDVAATTALARECFAAGQRAFVGRVCMDVVPPPPRAPAAYRDADAAAAVQAARDSVAAVRGVDGGRGLVRPVLTPRFAPACSRACLHGLGRLLSEENGAGAGAGAAAEGSAGDGNGSLLCQTHVAENTEEIRLVKELFPEANSYTAVYDDAGLLTPNTVLAHAIHISDIELALIKKRDAKVSHCPVSNSALTSGLARVRRLLDAGVDVGLGTDVSGGYSPSILEAARHAILVSRLVALTEGEDAKLSTEEVLYLATLGGAKVLGLQDTVGSFEVGKDWDAQMVLLSDLEENVIFDQTRGPVDNFGWESPDDLISKWLYSGDDRNTIAVWVKGRLIHTNDRFTN